MSDDLDKLFKKKKLYPEDVFIDVDSIYSKKMTNCHSSCHGGHDSDKGTTDDYNPTPAVPLPSVVWLFLTGMLFLLHRRKS